jgi:hypothetical protein
MVIWKVFIRKSWNRKTDFDPVHFRGSGSWAFICRWPHFEHYLRNKNNSNLIFFQPQKTFFSWYDFAAAMTWVTCKQKFVFLVKRINQ